MPKGFAKYIVLKSYLHINLHKDYPEYKTKLIARTKNGAMIFEEFEQNKYEPKQIERKIG